MSRPKNTLSNFMKERNLKGFFDLSCKQQSKVNPYVWGSSQYYELYILYKELRRIMQKYSSNDKYQNISDFISEFIKLGIIKGIPDLGEKNNKSFEKLLEYVKERDDEEEYQTVFYDTDKSVSSIFKHMKKFQDLWVSSEWVFDWVFPDRKWELHKEDSVIGSAVYIFILKYLGLVCLKDIKNFDT